MFVKVFVNRISSDQAVIADMKLTTTRRFHTFTKNIQEELYR